MPNESGGPIQVLDNSTASINLALALVIERLDTQQGLRGPVVIHDRLKVDDPIEQLDAVNLETMVSGFLEQASQPFLWRNFGGQARPNELQGEDPELNPFDPTLWLLSDRMLVPQDVPLDPHDPFLWVFGSGNDQGGSEPQNAPPNVATTSDIGAVVGRYAREDHTHGITTGSFTMTGTGFVDPDPTGTALFATIGPVVCLLIPELTGTSDATTFTLTGLPVAITPTRTSLFVNTSTNNATASSARTGRLNASSTTIDLFTTGALAAWTNSGTKGIAAQWIIYALL